MTGSTPDPTPDGPVEQPRQLELADEAGVFVVRIPGPSAREEIARLRHDGYGWSAIARSLNQREIPTPTGRGAWHARSVENHLNPEEWAAYIRARREEARRRRRGGEA